MTAKRRLSRIDRLLSAQGGVCALCGKSLNRCAATIDHRQPVALGGSDAWSNLQATHHRCNHERDQVPLEIWDDEYAAALATIAKRKPLTMVLHERLVRDGVPSRWEKRFGGYSWWEGAYVYGRTAKILAESSCTNRNR